MKLLWLYGPPATGKLTVAEEVATLTGFKIFHNHLTIDLYKSLFEFGTDHFRRLLAETRLYVFEEAAKAQLPGVIFTFTYILGTHDAFIRRVIEVVEKHGGEVDFVQLYCQPEELERRVLNASRKAFRKLWTVEGLREMMERQDLFVQIPGQKSLSIDNTALSPQQVARQIITHYALPDISISPHFSFKPMGETDAQAIAVWHYEPPYDFYDMAQDPDDLAELLNPQSWQGEYYAATDERGELAGFFTFRWHDATTLEIGLGLRPDLTGKGLGLPFLEAGLAFGRSSFAPASFILHVATFNTRAIRTYERAGFNSQQTYMQRTNGSEYEFLRMLLDH